VEIRNQLTLELITILQPPETIPDLTGPLAYSPDGRSIACASNTAIIIWDIQTGGVAKEIRCSAGNISLVWSSNGGTICTIDSKGLETFTVHTYGVSSGTASSPSTLRSGYNPHLWTVDESFRVMTTVWSGHEIKTIDIFEVGSTLTKIQSFSPRFSNTGNRISFSPTTHSISVSTRFNGIYIYDVWSSKALLQTPGDFVSQCFSSDGSLFAASEKSSVYVWRKYSGRYAICGRLWYQGSCNPSLLFSPTPSSILGHSENILQVLRLHELPTTYKTNRRQYAGLSRSGTRIATTHEMERTVTTIDILARTPAQFIDTGVAIESLFLTGNVLLVVGSGEVRVWLLTEEGLVDSVIGDRVGRGHSIWNVPFRSEWEVQVEGQVGIIKVDGNGLRFYHTDTGEVLHPDQEPHGNWDSPGDHHLGRNHLHFHNLPQRNIPLEDRWQTSQATLREGWVKDAEGKHRLWIPVEWRTSWDPADWRHDVTTQLSCLGGMLILVKF